MPEAQIPIFEMIDAKMKMIPLLTAAILMGTILPAISAVPIKQPLGRYAELWTDSPFTVKPPIDAPEVEEENPLDDYTLAGACKMKGGWFVVLINKKDRNERVRIRPGVENLSGFQVVGVENEGGYMDTKVQIQTRNGKKGTVEYDKKFIVLRKATPRAPTRKPTAKPGQRPPIPGRSSRPPMPTKKPTTTSTRPSRVRRVPNPPTR